MSSHIPQLVDSFYADFERTLEANPSMLFSGKFGSGKTYFLNHFFEQDKNMAKYLKIYTQPSAYYHAADGDVLGYLKYDILFELLRQSDLEELKGVKLTYFDMLLAMLIPEGNPEAGATGVVMGAAAALLLFNAHGSDIGAEKLSEMVEEGWASAKSLASGLEWLKEKRDEVNEDDATRLEHYLEALNQQKNSLFEASAINDLIKGLLERQAGAGKVTVLIVDDLDRMLPDACLSFLNMMSTHVRPHNSMLGKYGGGNIYSFDKVTMVGDMSNIRSFIRHRYGVKFDHSGYLSKVCGGIVYDYDPAFYLSGLAWELFFVPTQNALLKEYPNTEQQIENYFPTFNQAISVLVQSKFLTTRTILESEYFIQGRVIYRSVSFRHRPSGVEVHSSQFMALQVGYFLSMVFNGYSSFISLIENEKGYERARFEFHESELIASLLHLNQEIIFIPKVEEDLMYASFGGKSFRIRVVRTGGINPRFPAYYAEISDEELRNFLSFFHPLDLMKEVYGKFDFLGNEKF